MKQIALVYKCLMCLVLCVTFSSCSDDDNGVDNTALSLLSYTPELGGNISTEGTIELTFSKAVRQAPNTVIALNNTPVRIIITDNVVRVHYSFPLADRIELDIPQGALTDMSGAQQFEGLNLQYDIKLESRLFNAIVDASAQEDKANGIFNTVTDAINMAPSKAESPYLIFVTNGTYNEMITVNKPYIHLIGQSRDGVKIQFLANRVKETTDAIAWPYSVHNPASPACQAGYTASNEAVFLIKSNDFHAENISFINLYGALASRYEGGMGANGQADAMMTRADRISFYNCRMVSFQDTWWVRNNKSDSWKGLNNRNYADNCWIEGKTDYLYGSGNLLVENSTFFNVAYGSVMTAGSHYEGTTWGHIMKNCTVDGIPEAEGTVTFGRPWQGTPISVWINTTCKINMDPTGWLDMSGTPPYLFGEYNTVDAQGIPVDTSKRKHTFKDNSSETGTKECNVLLTKEETDKYTYEAMVMDTDNWDPKSYYETDKLPAITPALDGNVLIWDGLNKAICYLVFHNGKFVAQTAETTYSVSDNGGTWTVRAVNKYGSLGE